MAMKDMDWAGLGFGYVKTDCNFRCCFKDGEWGEVTRHSEETITMHMASTCLHYGQEAFEGLKAYRGRDGRVRLFRVEDNARRMRRTADYIRMEAPSVELFTEMVTKAVLANEAYIPPYGTGASLYVRPLLVGMGAQVGVKPASEYLFMVFVTPVGPYYKEGFRPIKAIIDRDHDRAAPRGTGNIKCGGNYAASLFSGEEGHRKGYPAVMYLDACEKRYIDECGAANFYGIKNGKYITPDSHSVLPSITNMSLCTIAGDIGLEVERRHVEVSELESFEEAGACGTAAVISPIGTIYDPDMGRTYTFSDPAEAGPWTVRLYDTLRAIQYGELPDDHGWITML